MTGEPSYSSDYARDRIPCRDPASAGVPITLGKRNVFLKSARLTPSQVWSKRAFDLVMAVIGLLLALPLLMIIALSVRITSQGPIIYRQQRVTKGGRVFTMYKFRTMARDAERYIIEHSIDMTTPFFKLENDPRVTRVGAFLRRFSLDELPQLVNVIKGDLSLVGPRPLLADQVAANLELLAPRHQVPGGLTGWWQINGRADIDPSQALLMDLFYIENWSFVLDLYILARTAGAILRRRGAY